MFRSVVQMQLKRLSSAYHTTSAARMNSTRKINPADWYFVQTGPGGDAELLMCNKKTLETTWYVPEGMTAEDLLAVPGAKWYWGRRIDLAKEYMEEKEAEKKANNGWDHGDDDQVREDKTKWKDLFGDKPVKTG